MRIALLGDVHGNADALEAVVRSIAAEKPDLVVCLGDSVGFYSHPSDCLRMVVESCQVIIAGDQDFLIGQSRPDALGGDADERAALQWTSERLSEPEVAFLQQLPVQVCFSAGFAVVHGAFADDSWLSGRIVPATLPENLRALQGRNSPRVGFFGNSDRSFFSWMYEERSTWGYLQGAEVYWPRGAEAVLIGPGSVGYPQDGDSRAAWGLVDLEERRFVVRRVEYDVERAAASCRSAGLPASLADRLISSR